MGRTSAALTGQRRGESVRVQRLEAGAAQAEGLIPLIAALMADSNVQFKDVARIAVCIGPGGFSGIRTGVAAARGIGLAAGIPVTGTTSFRILAAAFEKRGDVPETYGIAAPAGLKTIYCQILSRGSLSLTDIVALPHAETAAFFEGRAQIIVGPAARMLAENGSARLPVRDDDLVPDAETLAQIAPDLDPARDLPSPYYVRPADARPQTAHLISRLQD
jgi:tRNA threonylcarbamoyladenosine biosynthesis protein TsaB